MAAIMSLYLQFFLIDCKMIWKKIVFSSYTITVLSSSWKSVGVALPSTSQVLQKALDVLQASDLLNAAIFHAIISVG